MEKYALLVGVSEYGNDFEPIRTAYDDVLAMQEILEDPSLGQFESEHIKTVFNKDKQTIEESIYELFLNKKKDDLVLFYFSGHGIKDFRGNTIKLYLAAHNTRKDQSGLVIPTAISATQVHEYMDQSLSSRQVVILDCCYSGAFPKGMAVKGDVVPNQEDLESNFGGRGRAILTASSSVLPAFFGDRQLSEYTHFLVKGIKTGDADQNCDGKISLDELHSYISSEIRKTNLKMSPEFYPVKEGYAIVISRSNKSSDKSFFEKDSAEDSNLFALEDIQTPIIEIKKNQRQKIDYSYLEVLLSEERWSEASEETENIILSSTEMLETFNQHDVRYLSCDLVNTISVLWDKYSNERFGLWAQREVWKSDKVLEDPSKFLDCVGWLDKEYGFLSQSFDYSLSAPKGHLPLLFNLIFDLFVRMDECESNKDDVDV